jgi:chromosomal replication initiation ATPase DnaA
VQNIPPEAAVFPAKRMDFERRDLQGAYIQLLASAKARARRLSGEKMAAE